jgi:hypothetical protein
MAGFSHGRAARAGMAFVALWITSGSGEIRAHDVPGAQEDTRPMAPLPSDGGAASLTEGGPSR